MRPPFFCVFPHNLTKSIFPFFLDSWTNPFPFEILGTCTSDDPEQVLPWQSSCFFGKLQDVKRQIYVVMITVENSGYLSLFYIIKLKFILMKLYKDANTGVCSLQLDHFNSTGPTEFHLHGIGYGCRPIWYRYYLILQYWHLCQNIDTQCQKCRYLDSIEVSVATLVVVTDNEPPHTSKAFTDFLSRCGIKYLNHLKFLKLKIVISLLKIPTLLAKSASRSEVFRLGLTVCLRCLLL